MRLLPAPRPLHGAVTPARNSISTHPKEATNTVCKRLVPCRISETFTIRVHKMALSPVNRGLSRNDAHPNSIARINGMWRERTVVKSLGGREEITRCALSTSFQTRSPTHTGVETLAVNALGRFLGAILIAFMGPQRTWSKSLGLALAIGLLGGITILTSFGCEVIRNSARFVRWPRAGWSPPTFSWGLLRRAWVLACPRVFLTVADPGSI